MEENEVSLGNEASLGSSATAESGSVSPEPVLRKRRGRKPKTPEQREADKKAKEATQQVSTIDVELVSQSVQTVIGAFDQIIVSRIASATFLLTKKQAFAETFSQQAAITEPEKVTIGQLSGKIYQKHALSFGQYAEEIMLFGL